MKKLLIAALVCVNLALLGALGTDSATGQAPAARSGEYVLFTGKIAQDHDAVYLIDLPGGQMIGSLYKLDDFSDSLTLLMQQDDMPAWADRSFYYHYGRFLVEPLLSLGLLIVAWLQFRRGYEHTVLLNE